MNDDSLSPEDMLRTAQNARDYEVTCAASRMESYANLCEKEDLPLAGDIRLLIEELRAPYLTKDTRAVFESARAAAHYFEDRVEIFRITTLSLMLAKKAQNLEDIKFLLSHLETLAQSALVGTYGDPRKNE